MEKGKIQNLISQMTLEEKAGMCSGADFWHLKGVERLGIPSVMVTDGPHGLRKQAQGADHLGINESEKAICFPAGCATASSFDRELIRRQGELLGQECQAMNVSTILGPAMNIKRSPLCGRNFEYYSEDPLIAGKTGAAMVRGIQSRNVAASVKHFCCNNKETCRFESDSRVSERALREIYLKGFEIVVKEADPWTIMSSYNIVNGQRDSENKDLLTGILRDEWGFGGLVTTDWWNHAEQYLEIQAGNDVKMGCGYPERLKKDYEAGRITRDELVVSAKRVLELILKVD